MDTKTMFRLDVITFQEAAEITSFIYIYTFGGFQYHTC